MKYKKIVFFDMEMCCWNDGRKPSTGEIIEIGLAEVDVVSLEVTRRGQYIVKPQRDKVEEFCSYLTGHTQNFIDKNGRPLSEVIKTLVKKHGGKNTIYGSWGRDDLYLFSECDKLNIEHPFVENLNVSTMYHLKNASGSNRVGLDQALHRYGLNFEGQKHSAYDDAFNLAKLYIAMNRQG